MSPLNLLLDYISTKERGLTKSIYHKGKKEFTILQNLNCTYALQIRTTIYSLIEWIDPKLIPFFEEIDNIRSKTTKIMNI